MNAPVPDPALAHAATRRHSPFASSAFDALLAQLTAEFAAGAADYDRSAEFPHRNLRAIPRSAARIHWSVTTATCCARASIRRRMIRYCRVRGERDSRVFETPHRALFSHKFPLCGGAVA